MSKEFKEWEKKFSSTELKRERGFWLQSYRNLSESKSKDVTKGWTLGVDSWDQQFVQFCVYKADDVSDWQRFRSSMKGTTTEEKLQMLVAYFVFHLFGRTFDSAEWKLHKCRIDNYIGALRRGGQLNERYEIVK